MQFLAVGKAAFNRFFAAGIDGLATLRQAVGADAFPSIFPYVTRYDTSACLAGRASLKKLTCFTNLRIRGVFALAGPVGGPVPQKAVCGADVAIHRVVVEKVLASEASRIFSETVVADHPKKFLCLQDPQKAGIRLSGPGVLQTQDPGDSRGQVRFNRMNLIFLEMPDDRLDGRTATKPSISAHLSQGFKT
jgi:hypothetical protein